VFPGGAFSKKIPKGRGYLYACQNNLYKQVKKKGAILIINNDNNNNSHDNVYGAVIMTKVIARVHPVHLMNAD